MPLGSESFNYTNTNFNWFNLLHILMSFFGSLLSGGGCYFLFKCIRNNWECKSSWRQPKFNNYHQQNKTNEVPTNEIANEVIEMIVMK
ncbi:unnamed protein product [Adineta ricciae]|uniref:Uncharacterized protein n=1 Tax=Adineta ricciae TaxID=249248 RepID=A0A815WK61_ADIRI|nr:unnamed protein product [Adineta ricciae]CAF1546375.1 unnamed protein product [Adineta ricciae]